MTEKTAAAEPGNELTLESVWALFRETETQMKETDRRIAESQAETRKQMAETDRKIKEVAESQAKTDAQMAETAACIKETDRLIKELSRKWGNTSENIGFSAEEHFQTALSKTLHFAGIQFDDMMRNVRRERRSKSCEFDIMLVNHNAVAIIEVKHRVPKTLPETMVEQKAREFRTFFTEYKDYALYLGVAGMSIEAAALDEARKYGVGVLTQSGDAVECADIPLRVY